MYIGFDKRQQLSPTTPTQPPKRWEPKAADIVPSRVNTTKVSNRMYNLTTPLYSACTIHGRLQSSSREPTSISPFNNGWNLCGRDCFTVICHKNRCRAVPRSGVLCLARLGRWGSSGGGPRALNYLHCSRLKLFECDAFNQLYCWASFNNIPRLRIRNCFRVRCAYLVFVKINKFLWYARLICHVWKC